MSPDLTGTPLGLPGRTFRVVSHKPGVLAPFAPFGAVRDLGVSVDSDHAARDLWWMPQDWAATVLRAGIALPQLTAPGPGFIAALDPKWRNRDVGTLRKRDIPRFFAKHPEYLAQTRVVLSTPGEHSELLPPTLHLTEDLAEGQFSGAVADLPGDVLLQMDAMLPCVVEVRCWVAAAEVTTHAAYRIGMVGWDSSLFLEMLFNTDGAALTEQAVQFARRLAAEVDGPPGYAVDIGITVSGTATVLRVWPAWAADPLDAEPVGVFTAIAAAHDFDHTAQRWRWTPDMRIYTRPQPEQEP